MLVIAIIISIILIIALIRVGVIVEYSSDGLFAWLKIGFIKTVIHGDDKVKKPKKKPKKKDKSKSFKPGSLHDFLEMVKIFKNTLGRLRRKLLIKTLILHYTAAGSDPAKTAMQFGAANAVFGTVMPIIERHFRVKKRDLRASADFDSDKPGVYAKITVSIAIWESIYVLFALLPLFKIAAAGASSGKETQKNGESTNKRTDGNHNAENKRDD